MYKYLESGGHEDGARLFVVVVSDEGQQVQTRTQEALLELRRKT